MEMGADRVSPCAARVRKHRRTTQVTVLRPPSPLGAVPYLAGYLVGPLFVGHAPRSAELASSLAARREEERS